MYVWYNLTDNDLQIFSFELYYNQAKGFDWPFKIQRCDPPKIAHVCLEERMHAYRKMCKTKLKTTDVEENRYMVRFYIMITVKK